MLILNRHVGEELVIAGDIRLKIVAIRGKSVSVGIEAPRSAPVIRREVLVEDRAGFPSITFKCGSKRPHSAIHGATQIEQMPALRRTYSHPSGCLMAGPPGKHI